MPNALRQQAEWFRLFLDSYCILAYFPTEVDEEMRRIKVTRPEVMAVIQSCRIVHCEYPRAGVVALTLEDDNVDEQRLKVSVEVENNVLALSVVWVERPDGD